MTQYLQSDVDDPILMTFTPSKSSESSSSQPTAIQLKSSTEFDVLPVKKGEKV